MHKRSNERLLERKIRGLIFRHSHHDYKRAESVCKITRVEIADLLHEPLLLRIIPDVEKGEVLIDSRGQGSFQRIPRSLE
jgi:hypothetical protein